MELGLGHRLDQASQAGDRSGRGGREVCHAVDATIPARSIGPAGRTACHRRATQPCPRSSSPAPAASSAATSSRACSPPATASSPWSATPTAGETVLERLPQRRRGRDVEIAHRRRHPARTRCTGAGRRRCASSTSPPSRATSTAARTCASSTPRARAPSSRRCATAGVRRLVHMGAMGVEDDPTLHYASSKAKAEALVRESGLDWTILKPSLQFGEGDGFFNIIAGLVRLSPGVVPVPGDGSAPLPADPRRRRRARSWSGRSPTRRRSAARSSSAARATGRTARSPARSSPRSASGGPSCRCRSPLIRLVAGTAERVHLPFPVATDQLRQLRLDNIGPLDVIPSRFGFEPRPMEGALGYLADQAARPGRQAGRPADRRGRMTALRPVVGGRRLARDRRRHRARRGRARRPRSTTRPAPPARTELTGRRRRRGHARSSTPPRRTSRPCRPGRGARARRRGPRWRPERRRPGRRRGGHRRRATRSSSDIDRPRPQRCAARSPTCRTSGTPEAGLTVSDAVVARHAALVAALDATDGLDARLGAADAPARWRPAGMSRLLAEHDAARRRRPPSRAAAPSTPRRSSCSTRPSAPDRRRPRALRDAAGQDGRRRRSSTSGSTRTTTTTSRCGTSTRRSRRSAGKVTKDDARRGQGRGGRRARALPPDTRGLVVIMAEIGRGGMNGAVIAIEEARATLTDALEAGDGRPERRTREPTDGP